ncbi:MAG: multicopper oxidase domain-containing protein [Halobacteriales archaeon]|nr:multicopper oxidase domain-containing protein [Halobacteriales archaeon]
MIVSTAITPVAAHEGNDTDSGPSAPTGNVCPFNHSDWRSPDIVAGVQIDPDPSCNPDNPAVVAAVTAGTNRVPKDVLRQSGLSSDAVVKRNDSDGDGDPDEIHIRLEVAGLNEYNAAGAFHTIAPGIHPAFWVFVPKTRGMVERNSPAERLMQMPSPPLRVEQGDTVRVTLANTHYLPHTIHFHGVDHPYMVNGQGNDGVPQTSEQPILPGERRTYEFTPRKPGTNFYHCHVVPDVHVMMGLNGLFIVAKNRSDNRVQTINPGGGRVRHPSAAVDARYDAAYDLQYQDVDARLHRIPQKLNDPRAVAAATNRKYDRTDADPDFFLLNGRSFPYTLWSSQVIVQPDERYRLRILNGGSETVSLHTHGHKFTIEAYDGVELTEDQEITRDVVTISAAQRVDLTLNTTTDGLHSYGRGIWFMHNHREEAVTTNGISPGGDIGLITYRALLTDNGMPRTNTNLSQYFDPAFYRGEVPLWADLDPKRLGTPPAPASASDATATSTSRTTDGTGPPMGRLMQIGLFGLAVFLIGLVVSVLIERRDT